jgi:hypothetical protein
MFYNIHREYGKGRFQKREWPFCRSTQQRLRRPQMQRGRKPGGEKSRRCPLRHLPYSQARLPRWTDSNRELAPRLSIGQCRCRLPLHAVIEGRLILLDVGRLVSPPLKARIQLQSRLSVVCLSFFNASRASRREKPRVTAKIQSTSLSSRIRRSAGGRHSSSAATQHTQRS